jgi:hypothetical protein
LFRSLLPLIFLSFIIIYFPSHCSFQGSNGSGLWRDFRSCKSLFRRALRSVVCPLNHVLFRRALRSVVCPLNHITVQAQLRSVCPPAQSRTVQACTPLCCLSAQSRTVQTQLRSVCPLNHVLFRPNSVLSVRSIKYCSGTSPFCSCVLSTTVTLQPLTASLLPQKGFFLQRSVNCYGDNIMLDMNSSACVLMTAVEALYYQKTTLLT